MANRLKVDSVNALRAAEKEILARIAALPNGGYLLILDPWRCLAQCGCDVAPLVKAEINRRYPAFARSSELPFNAVRASSVKQPMQVTVRGLFPHE
jgi:hypothetical protein